MDIKLKKKTIYFIKQKCFNGFIANEEMIFKYFSIMRPFCFNRGSDEDYSEYPMGFPLIPWEQRI